MTIFISKRPAKCTLLASMCTFLISCTRQIQYCRYWGLCLYDETYAVLKHLRLPRTSSFKIKIASSNFAENGKKSRLTEWRRVNCARATRTFQKWFKILAQGMKIARNLLKMIAAAYPKQWALRVSESYYLLSKLFSTWMYLSRPPNLDT